MNLTIRVDLVHNLKIRTESICTRRMRSNIFVQFDDIIIQKISHMKNIVINTPYDIK